MGRDVEGFLLKSCRVSLLGRQENKQGLADEVFVSRLGSLCGKDLLGQLPPQKATDACSRFGYQSEAI